MSLASFALLAIGFIQNANAYTAYISDRVCVVVFDTVTDSITGTICAGDPSHWIGSGSVISPDGKKIYATGEDTASGSTKIFVIDTNTRSVTKEIDIPTYPSQAFITPDGSFLYVPYSTITSVIDTTTDTVVDSLPFNLYSAVFTSDGMYAYYINSGKISIFDIKNKTVISTFTPTWQITNAQGQKVTSTLQSLFLGITPDGSRIYAGGRPTNPSDTTVAVAIDPTTNAVVGRVQLPSISFIGSPGHFAFTPDGQRGYLIGSGQPIAFDTLSNTFISLVFVSYNTDTVAITPDGRYGYSASSFDGIEKFDTTTNVLLPGVATSGSYLLPGNIVIQPESTAPISPKNLGDCGCTGEGNPINAATGNKFQAETDFVGAASTGIQLKRFYNSQDTTATTFGANWHSTWHRSVALDTSGTIASVTRADGRVDTFMKNSSSVWTSDPDVTSGLTAVMSGATQTGWKLVTAEDSIELYTLDGRLSSVANRAGNITQLAYDANKRLTTVTGPFGHSLTFAYNASNLISTVTLPDGGVLAYAYDANNNLTSVTYPDKTVRQYVYNEQANTTNTSLIHALTGIIDESVNRFATYQYDTQGRAISSQHAGGEKQVTITYNTDGSSTVTDALGNVHSYGLTTQFGVVKPTTITGAPIPDAGGQAFSYDNNGFIASRTDWNGNVTAYTHNTRGLESSRTEASGTALARAITTQWHPTFHLPTQISEPSGVTGVNRITTFSYDAVQGTLLQKTITAGSLSRTWKYSYTKAGQISSATDPNGHLTSYLYDAKGNLASVKNALGKVTITAHDADGRLTSLKDPNGLITTITYTPRGEIASRTVGQEVTTFSYTPNNQLQSLTRPDGSVLEYSYNTAHQLTRITDALGNHIDYTLDLMGNVLTEDVFDKSGSLRRSLAHSYDSVNRLAQNLGAYNNETTSLSRDANGNVTGITDPNNHTVSNSFDVLNRLATRIDPNKGQTTAVYNVDDSVASVTDPRGVVTQYGYDGLGNQLQVISPDSGTTSRTFDAAGNVLTSTDARGYKTTYFYDKLNRISKELYADGSKSQFTYDKGRNGIGRLTSMTDPSGSTTWAYDQHGRVVLKTQKTGSAKLTTAHSYNAVTGQLLTTRLPSKTVISYSYDLNGKPAAITTGTTSIATQISYDPFGGPSQWLQTGSLNHYRVSDLDGRPSNINFANSSASAGEQQINLTRDLAGQITQIDDNTVAMQSFAYDPLNELTHYTTPTLTQDYSYDANGNRTALSAITTTTSNTNYTIATTSDQLLSSTTGTAVTNYTLDAAGNLINDGQRQFTFNARGKLAKAINGGITTSYSFNGLGVRVAKSNSPTSATVYTQDGNGNIIGEYDKRGSPVQETIYLGNLPVAVIKSGTLYYINPDHLGAPHTITTSSGAPVWTWNHDPFGNGSPTISGNFTYNNRFPGQTYDVETGLFHNNARDYDPAKGRYIQSDPIGLGGGVNTYAYVGNDAVNGFDPWGLEPLSDFGFPPGYSTADAEYDAYASDLAAVAVADATKEFGSYSYGYFQNHRVTWSNYLDNASTSFYTAGALSALVPGTEPAAIPLMSVGLVCQASAYILKPTPAETTMDAYFEVTSELAHIPGVAGVIVKTAVKKAIPYLLDQK